MIYLQPTLENKKRKTKGTAGINKVPPARCVLWFFIVKNNNWKDGTCWFRLKLELFSISTHTHSHRVKQLVWLKLTHYIGCEFLVHRVLFALRKESVLREHTLAVIWGDQVFRHPQNICCFFFFFIKCRTTGRNDRARGTAHLFGGKPWRAAETLIES